MKSVAKEIVTRLVGYSDGEAFEVVKLVKVGEKLWSVIVREPEEKAESEDNSEDSEGGN